RRRPAQPCPYPRHQLARRERLGHIVVGAQLQPQYAVELVVARGQEDHRHLAEGAQLPAHFKAADIRQPHIQHHHLHAAVAQLLHRLAPQRAMACRITLAAQGVQQGIGNGGLVFDDEHPGRLVGHAPSIAATSPAPYTLPMNYRHAFHAGNHADVLKHITLLALIDSFKRKDSPFFVLDTHAGRGRYLLSSEESRKTAEIDDGVMRLMAQPTLPEVVERYLKAVQADNPVGAMITYPGSPLLTAQAMRAQDRLAACELQEEEAAALKALFARDSRVGVHPGDGYAQIRSLLPPKLNGTKIGRGLVLIDPPYEAQDAEYPRILAALSETLTRWPQATCAVWSPIKQRRSVLHSFRKAAALPARSALLVEFLVRPDDSPLRLNGSGMLLLNPPWQFDRVLGPALPVLKKHLGEAGASTRMEWLKAAE